MQSNRTVNRQEHVCETRFFASLGFPSFFIAYNTIILLLQFSILVKMRAVFCVNLQN